jgi:hypothetical protein
MLHFLKVTVELKEGQKRNQEYYNILSREIELHTTRSTDGVLYAGSHQVVITNLDTPIQKVGLSLDALDNRKIAVLKIQIDARSSIGAKKGELAHITKPVEIENDKIIIINNLNIFGVDFSQSPQLVFVVYKVDILDNGCGAALGPLRNKDNEQPKV